LVQVPVGEGAQEESEAAASSPFVGAIVTPRSVRSKLLKTVLLTLLAVTSTTLAVVAGYSARVAGDTLAELEAQIRHSIETKGSSLVANQATALRSLVAESAFGEVATLVRVTKERESDVVYGVFVGADGKPWAFVAPPRAQVDVAALARELTDVGGAHASEPRARVRAQGQGIERFGQKVFEFSATVPGKNGPLGTIVYGLSSARITNALEHARAAARTATLRTAGLLGLLGLGALVLGLLLAWRAAERITAPIKVLTIASQRIASGDKDARVDIRSGDEIETLATGFNRMVDDLSLTQAELERLNRDLEQRVQERTSELRQANADLESFSYSVSHDLRAPLRAIDSFVQILEEEHGPRLDEDARELFGRTRAAAVHMGVLIDNLLDLSRLGRAAMELMAVDMNALTAEVLRELREQEPGRNVDLRIADLPGCQGDPVFLRQVLVNLVANAFKFTQKRELAIIEIGRLDTEKGCAYFVRDNGAGFDMRYSDKLFGVFQRLHGKRDFAGTGVGLSIVRRIVQRHGGLVWAESAPDQGATFYFTVAAAGASPAAVPA
jgi:signal transduction histidine kinase